MKVIRPKAIARDILGRLRFHSVVQLDVERMRNRPVADGVIVSLTSYGKRLDTVYLTVKSILDQTLRPERVVLYLDSSSNDVKLCDELIRLKRHGLEIKTGVRDLGPHKKYRFAFEDYDSKTVVTVDDDVIYGRDAIRQLVQASSQAPGCVVARRVNRIKVSDGAICPYSKWDYEFMTKEITKSHSYCATGVGGVLYPKGIMPKLVLDEDLFMKLAPRADDLWLKVIEVQSGVQVALAPSFMPHPYQLPDTQMSGLGIENVKGGGNDEALRLLLDYFNLTPSRFANQ